MKTHKPTVGRKGEEEACSYLCRNGHRILARNWRGGHLELDIVTLEDEDGKELSLRVERYFYFNGEEYVILSADLEGTAEDPDRYVMRVTPVEGEEDMEEFTPIEDEELEQRLIKAAETVLDSTGLDEEEE